MNTTTTYFMKSVPVIGDDGSNIAAASARDDDYRSLGYVAIRFTNVFDGTFGQSSQEVCANLTPDAARQLAALLTREADYTERPWATLMPNGRDIYYEGDEPEQFAQEILAEFGFDPSDDEGWAFYIPADERGEGFYSCGFHCPAEHLDAIYGSDRWMLGS